MNLRYRLVSVLAAFAGAALGMAATASAQAERVGEVARLVPDVHIARARQRIVAQVQSPVQVQDTVSTERYARVRLRLDDGSVLNVGAESALTITVHDSAAERSALDLTAGRIRARVVRRVRPGAGFEVRTPTAVAGVVGAHFVVSIIGDYSEVLCLDGEVAVRNADASVEAAVRLRAGEFTRIFRLRPPEPASAATPQQIRQALEQTDIAAGPFDWSRVEMNWPPAGCGAGVQVLLRAWVNQKRGEQVVEVPLDRDLVSGTLLVGTERIDIEDGRGLLASSPASAPAEANFRPRDSLYKVAVKGLDPKKFVPGDGWRAPRAVFAGDTFYVLGPMGNTANPQLDFGGQPAQLLWSGPCGAGFLAPAGKGGEYDVTISAMGRALARGRMSLIEINYRTPMPPTVTRGQTTQFGVDLMGLLNLATLTQGRPVLTARITNQAPQVIGNLKSNTKNAKVSGQAIFYSVMKGNIGNAGVARLNGSGRAQQSGTLVLSVNLDLDDALEEPRTPMTPATGN